MFEVSVQESFAAGHALRNYKGKCENVHGHNYRVEVTVQGAQLNDIGLLVDFLEVKRIVRGIIERLDHHFINDLAPFDVLNPSAENLAKYFYDQIASALAAENGVRVHQIKIWETDVTSAIYRPPAAAS